MKVEPGRVMATANAGQPRLAQDATTSSAPPRNYTLEVEHGAAIVRVFRNAELQRHQEIDAARSLLAEARALTYDAEVLGIVIDLRRVGIVPPEVEAPYRELAAAWEASGQPVAFLTLDPIQKLQLNRIVGEAAPRMGALFADRNEARRFVGASSMIPDDASSSDLAAMLRTSKNR
jgi:hypothetical protein